jgi:hypothetical protein
MTVGAQGRRGTYTVHSVQYEDPDPGSQINVDPFNGSIKLSPLMNSF